MTYQKTLLHIFPFLLCLLSLLPSHVLASSNFSLNQALAPKDKPKAAVIEIHADNHYAKQYAEDLLLSMQNELLLNGMDIIIGKENATDSNTLVMNIDLSIQTGMLSHVRREDRYNYFVENISRVSYNTTFFTISKEDPFLELSLSLDTQILGLTESSYDSIESMDSLFGRSANLMTNLFLAVYSDTSDLPGIWQDLLGSTVIEVPNDPEGGEYGGFIKTTGNNLNIGFSPGEMAYRISNNSNASDRVAGKFKFRYTNGREPEWLPAEFSFVGNIMIVKPMLRSKSAGMSFFIKQPQKQASSSHTQLSHF
ncbi:MAG: hypothetical protein ABW080_03530 [Candidatus Thiodiazotropha sp.]